MNARDRGSGRPFRVLHVLPRDEARGAQVFARVLADRGNHLTGQVHETAVLFPSTPTVLAAAHELGRDRLLPVIRGFDPVAARRLRRLVAQRRPDVVVAHGGESLKYVVWAAARTGSLVVGHSIGISPGAATTGVRGALYGTLWRRADLVVAVSTDVAAHLHRDLGVVPEAVTTIPNGRDPAAHPVHDHGQPGPVRLVFVGQLTSTKRPLLFVDVVQQVRGHGLDVAGVIVGTGPEEAAVRVAAARAGGIAVMGRRLDVPAILARGSVFVFTSAPEGEGMPGVLIEAGLAGLPTVTTDVPGARDVVIEGVTGRVVPHDDPRALADAVSDLVRSPEARRTMGREARAHCVTRLGLDDSVAAWVEALSSIRSRPRRGRRTSSRTR